jgi:hypothetical protein
MRKFAICVMCVMILLIGAVMYGYAQERNQTQQQQQNDKSPQTFAELTTVSSQIASHCVKLATDDWQSSFRALQDRKYSSFQTVPAIMTAKGYAQNAEIRQRCDQLVQAIQKNEDQKGNK